MGNELLFCYRNRFLALRQSMWSSILDVSNLSSQEQWVYQSGTPTVGVSNNWVDVSRAIVSTPVAAARAGQACGSTAHCCLIGAPSRKRNCHSFICHSTVLNSVGTQAFFWHSRTGKEAKSITSPTSPFPSEAGPFQQASVHFTGLPSSDLISLAVITHHPCLHPCKPQNLSFSVASRAQIMSSAQ